MSAPVCESWPDLWFNDDPRDAVAACCSCPLITPCLNAALKAEGAASAQYRYGVWGGLTPIQRAALAEHDARNRPRVRQVA